MTDFFLQNQQLDFIDSGHASSVTSPGSSVPVNGENNLVNNHSINSDFTALQLDIVSSKTRFLQRPGGALLNERNRLTKRRNDEAFDHSELPKGSEDIASTVESEDSDYGGGLGELKETSMSELTNGWWQPTERTRLVRRIRYERRIPQAVEMNELANSLSLTQRHICRNNRAYDEMIEIDNDSFSAGDEPLSSEEELEFSDSLHAQLYGQNSAYGRRLNEGGPGFNSRQHLDELEEKREEEERPFYTKHASVNGYCREGLGFNSAVTTSSRSNGCPDIYSDMYGLYGRGTYEPESPWVWQQHQPSSEKRVDDRVVYNYLERYKDITGLTNDSANNRISDTSVTKPMPLGLAINKCKNVQAESEKISDGNLYGDILNKKNNKKKKSNACVGLNEENSSCTLSDQYVGTDNATQQTNGRFKTYANNDKSHNSSSTTTSAAANEPSRVETMRRRKQQKQNKKNEIVVQVANVPGYRGDQSLDVVLSYINSGDAACVSPTQHASSARGIVSTPAASLSLSESASSSLKKTARKHINKKAATKVEVATSSKAPTTPSSAIATSASDRTCLINDKESSSSNVTDAMSTAVPVVEQTNCHAIGGDKVAHHHHNASTNSKSKKSSFCKKGMNDSSVDDAQSDAVSSRQPTSISSVKDDVQSAILDEPLAVVSSSIVDESKEVVEVSGCVLDTMCCGGGATSVVCVEPVTSEIIVQSSDMHSQQLISPPSASNDDDAAAAAFKEEDEIIIITDFDKLCSDFDTLAAEREVGFQEVVRKKPSSRRHKPQQSAMLVPATSMITSAAVATHYPQQDYQQQQQQRSFQRANNSNNNNSNNIKEHAPYQQHLTCSNSMTSVVSRPSHSALHSKEIFCAAQRKDDCTNGIDVHKQPQQQQQQLISPVKSLSLTCAEDNGSLSCQRDAKIQILTLFEYMNQLKYLQSEHAEDFPIEFDEVAKRAFLCLQKRLRDDFAALQSSLRFKIEAT